jgi:hypothetical protein
MQEEQTQESNQELAPVEAKPGKRSKAGKKRAAVESQPEEEQPQAEPETQEAAQVDEATPVEQKPQAAPAATETDDQAGAARDLFTQGIQSLLRGEYDASENQLGQALIIRQKLGDRAGQIEVLEQLGHLCYLRGTAEQAQEYYRQAGAMRRT